MEKLYCAPGNGGIACDAECVPIDAMDQEGMLAFAKEKSVDFVVVAPDDPLGAGMVDTLEAAGFPCFGPNAKACLLYTSNERTSTAVEKLWEAILMTVRVSEDNDPKEAWDRHNEELKAKCEKLNSCQLEYLHYESSNGTDFKCWLISEAEWHGGGDTLQDGTFYNPNMPTEEVFTSPMKGKCEGTLVSTMPLSYQGNLIDKFSVTFENGKVVSCQAEQGQELLEKMIGMDEGACMLGELALVPDDSPISNSGILFYNTLFDENAACHVALGRGFNETIRGYENMSNEERCV